jgi:parallel beta-helix repeat protein
MRRVLIGVCAAALLGAGAVTIGGAEPAAAGLLPACGTVTTNTVLSSDCEAPLIVGASNIVVNLNGHSVVCTGSTPVGVQVDDRTRVAVLFGHVTGGCDQAGVRFLRGGQNLAMGVTANGHNSGFFTAFPETNRNRLLSNRASFNTFGVVLQGTNNQVEGNVFTRNGTGVIAQTALQNVVARNWVVKNDDFGIYLDNTATGNRVIGNVALSNSPDLTDINADCDANLWLFNFFATANQPCIH